MVHGRSSQLYLLVVHWILRGSTVTISSVAIQSNASSEKGSSIQLVCTKSSSDTGQLAWYKTDTEMEAISGTGGTRSLTTCFGSTCVTVEIGRYRFSADNLRAYVNITNLNRVEDMKWWTCRYEGPTFSKKSLQLIVYSTPAGLAYSSVPTQSKDLSSSAVTLTCKTTNCTYPAPTFNWHYKQYGSSRKFYPNSGHVSNQTVSCSDQERIYMYTLSLPQYTQFPGDVDTPVTFQCGLDFVTLSEPLYTTETPNITFAATPDGPPVIQGYSNGSVYSVIENVPQNLSCSITGGNPKATLSWTCYSGQVRDRSSGRTVTKKITWSASRDQSGHCKCQSSHQISGTQSTQLNVKILFTPSVPQFRMNNNPVSGVIKVINDSNPSIRCITTTGNPPPTKYTWRYPGNSQYVGSTLTLNAVHTSPNGIYTCTAENQMDPTVGDTVTGSNASSIILQVLLSPTLPILKYNTTAGPVINTRNPVNVVKGDYFMIFCSSTGDPPPSYQWTNQSGTSLILTIINIQMDMTRTCTVSNIMRPTSGGYLPGVKSAAVTFSVLYGPSEPILVYHYSNSGSVTVTTPLRVQEGKSFTVTCAFISKPATSSYCWSGKVSSSSHTLRINSITREQAGTQTCHAENTMDTTFGGDVTGRNSSTITVDVLYKPIIGAISDQVKEENTLLNLSCPVTPGLPAVTHYTWTRTRDSRRWTGNPLIISAVQKGDADTYTCTANNVMDLTGEPNINGTDSEEFSLDVQYKASIISFQVLGVTGDSVIVDENDSVRFQCVVSSNPGANITIQKDGHQQTAKDNTMEITYQLTTASCLDAGTYVCTGTNKYNAFPALSGNTLLFVRCSPRPSESVETLSNITKALNNDVALSITVTAYPDPSTFVWSRYTEQFGWTVVSSGGSFIITSHGLQSNLTVADIHKSDLGQYRVEVNNGIGSPYRHVYSIHAQDTPETPTSLRQVLKLTTDSSLVIQWKPGFNGGLVQTFRIEYKKASDVHWTVKTVQEPATNITLAVLSAGTIYEVRISAFNALGTSSTTEIEAFKTAEIPVPSASNTGELVGTFFGGIALMVMVIAAIFIFRRRGKLGTCMSLNVSSTTGKHVEDVPNDQHVYYNMSLSVDPTEDTTLDESGCIPSSASSTATYETAIPINTKEHVYTDLKVSSQGVTKSEKGIEMYENLKIQTSR